MFTYDYVFPPDILQQTVYENSAFPLVESVVEGYNGTMFAYGQTGKIYKFEIERKEYLLL